MKANRIAISPPTIASIVRDGMRNTQDMDLIMARSDGANRRFWVRSRGYVLLRFR